MGIVGGVDEIQVVGPLGDQLVADVRQALQRDGAAKVPVADLLVLAEDAAQIAAGEKHRAGAGFPGNARFLPEMKCCPRNF